MFYWNHRARRQTSPMVLHGLEVTDPIRQFNDYGYTMCSTIAGINCAIWDAMGRKAKYWDISFQKSPEVEYDGRWHMYDNSMSALYTLCDGRTIAGVADIGMPGACAASGGVVEPGHVARYHCLMATSPKGFLTGADTVRSLDGGIPLFQSQRVEVPLLFLRLGPRPSLHSQPARSGVLHAPLPQLGSNRRVFMSRTTARTRRQSMSATAFAATACACLSRI